MSENETEKTFIKQAKQFRALQKVLSAAGDFKSMQTATICAGLAEVAESLALEAKHRKLRK